MKEALAAVLTGLQSLNEAPHERPVDRLHALAASQLAAMTAPRQAELCSLGRDLIAFKFANRVESHEPAVSGLANVLKWSTHRLSLKPWDYWPVSRWAIHEWAIDFCAACSGKKEVPAHFEQIEGRQPMKPCQACAGTGKRRYSDQERAEALGNLKALERGLDVAHAMIGEAERQAVRTAQVLLEKWQARY